MGFTSISTGVVLYSRSVRICYLFPFHKTQSAGPEPSVYGGRTRPGMVKRRTCIVGDRLRNAYVRDASSPSHLRMARIFSKYSLGLCDRCMLQPRRPEATSEVHATRLHTDRCSVHFSKL